MANIENVLKKEEFIGLYDFRKKRDFPFEENTLYKFQIVSVHHDKEQHKLHVIYLVSDMDEPMCERDILNEYDTRSYDFMKLIKILYPNQFFVIHLIEDDFLRLSGTCRIKYINNYPIIDISTIRRR